MQQGDVRAKERIYWADPNFFEVLALPVIAGDPATALKRSDGLVLPRAMARKYFGRDAPIGETLRLAGEHPMTVTAVIEDLPDRGTELNSGIFASGLGSFSGLAKLDQDPARSATGDTANFSISVHTYLLMAPGANIQVLQAAMPALMETLWSRAKRPPGLAATIELVRLDRVHLHPQLFPAVPGRFAMTIALTTVILLIACINFINLATARASRRAREVMVRKAAGAGRGSLIVQFLSESFLYVMAAVCLAVAITEMMLPATNAFLNSGMVFDYWKNPALIGWVLLGAVTLSVLAGLYPAFVLSSFKPAGVLRGRHGAFARSARHAADAGHLAVHASRHAHRLDRRVLRTAHLRDERRAAREDRRASDDPRSVPSFAESRDRSAQWRARCGLRQQFPPDWRKFWQLSPEGRHGDGAGHGGGGSRTCSSCTASSPWPDVSSRQRTSSAPIIRSSSTKRR